MKLNPWAFPLLAAIAAGAWIGSQKRSVAVLEHEITVITKRMQQARAMLEPEADADGSAGGTDRGGRSIDWKDLTAEMSGVNEGTIPDMRTMIRLQKLLLDLPAEDLLAHLDEIAGLDLEPAVRRQLESAIIGILAEKDPRSALERMADRLGDENSGLGWQLNSALRQWAEKDPSAAASWLDARIAAGGLESKSLDGKNTILNRYEGSLISAMLKHDPAAATARVAAMDEEQRGNLFEQGFFFQIGNHNAAAYARLVRDTMAPDKVAGILANSSSWLAMSDGFEKVDDYISAIQATDGERQPIVEKVMNQKLSGHHAGELTLESLDEVRAWAMKQAPGVVDRATGEAIANHLSRSPDQGKAIEFLLHYHEAGNSDDVLAGFLKSPSIQHLDKEKSMELINRIRDPELRESIRNSPQFSNP
jgi:hypothetical protein